MRQPSGWDEEYWLYNCRDTTYTFNIVENLEKVIESLGLQKPLEFQNRLYPALLDTMLRGMRFNIEQREEYEKLILDEIESRKQWIEAVLGHPLNINSNKQMKALFYTDFAQKEIKNVKTKSVTLDDKALAVIGQKEPLLKPLIRKIQELRSLKVFLSTFVRMPLDSDNRMRTSYNIAGTETFRFSSSMNAFGNGGNLANLPKGGHDEEDGLELPNIRGLFLPDPGYTLYDVDLSKADLRIVVWEADIKEMKAMLNEGRDPYIELAREFFKDPSIKKFRPDGSDDPKYKQFKSCAHAFSYLGQPKGLAPRLGLLVSEIEKLQKWYFEKYPGVKQYQENIKNQINKQRYVQNIFGNRWYAMERIDDRTYRQAAAFVPQSTVALIINRGFVNIYENFKEAQVLLQCHDSLVIQAPSDMPDAQERILKECSIVLPYDDPMIVPVGCKSSSVNWGLCG